MTHPATGVYCIVGDGWGDQGGPFAATLIGSTGDAGSVVVNPYFLAGPAWRAGCSWPCTPNSTGTATDGRLLHLSRSSD